MRLQEKLNERVSQLEPEVIQVKNTKEGTLLPLVKSNAFNLPEIVPSFAISMDEAKDRIRMLQQFVKDLMIPGQDYGVIPGCNKPSLFKSGAEKLCDIFGFAKTAEVVRRLENWDKGIFAYEVRAVLINKKTGLVEAEGFGSCNSKEKKYCNQDAFTITNTILKMAKKRAFIDAVLSATRTSAIFTQDEDIIGATQRKDAYSNDSEPGTVTKNQLNKIQSLVKEMRMPIPTAKQLLVDLYEVGESKNLSKQQADRFIKELLKMKK